MRTAVSYCVWTTLETTLLKKSDELNDACRSFFDRLKGYLKEKETESFYSKEIRSAFRLTPSILENIKTVSRNPTVSQRSDGLLKVQKDRDKEIVIQSNHKLGFAIYCP